MRELVLPSTVKRFGGQMTVGPGKVGGDTILSFKVYAEVPPEILYVGGGWGTEVPATTTGARHHLFYNVKREYELITLYVPAASIEAYRNDEFWGGFVNILPIEQSGIDEVEIDDSKSLAPVYYDLHGLRVTRPKPGELYVRVTGDKTEKIVY